MGTAEAVGVGTVAAVTVDSEVTADLVGTVGSEDAVGLVGAVDSVVVSTAAAITASTASRGYYGGYGGRYGRYGYGGWAGAAIHGADTVGPIIAATAIRTTLATRTMGTTTRTIITTTRRRGIILRKRSTVRRLLHPRQRMYRRNQFRKAKRVRRSRRGGGESVGIGGGRVMKSFSARSTTRGRCII